MELLPQATTQRPHYSLGKNHWYRNGRRLDGQRILFGRCEEKTNVCLAQGIECRYPGHLILNLHSIEWMWITKYLYWQTVISDMVHFMLSVQRKHGQIPFVWHQEFCSNKCALSYLFQFRPQHVPCYGCQGVIPGQSVGLELTPGQVFLEGVNIPEAFHVLLPSSSLRLTNWNVI
jgi:hypothetical protein